MSELPSSISTMDYTVPIGHFEIGPWLRNKMVSHLGLSQVFNAMHFLCRAICNLFEAAIQDKIG